MDENKEEVHLGLDLGLGLNDCNPTRRENHTPQNKKRALFLDLSIPLHTGDQSASRESSSSLKIMGKDSTRQGIVERINGFCGKEDDESKASMDNFECRKKLRLTRDQTTLLEDSFKQQTTLNTDKIEANRIGLRILEEKLRKIKRRKLEIEEGAFGSPIVTKDRENTSAAAAAAGPPPYSQGGA
ncbi:Homeobox-leucine zipper protein HAT14 [Striga hermonthica]|uniref:Homeobox-leucine zipper protein HAT14 n=1 Tax=Striga hermonthica TaxID=68872 RepID=A0A9N7MPW3_STRHE|nr:Homeobox-leucine zipper protein HAT14 [Striga hermonthica]